VALGASLALVVGCQPVVAWQSELGRLVSAHMHSTIFPFINWVNLKFLLGFKHSEICSNSNKFDKKMN
jgi:hypothetical protein